MTGDLQPAIITTPGIYTLTAEEYHADPVPGGSLSSTGARELLDVYGGCPAKFRYHLTRPRPPKREFDLGNAAHHLVLGIGPTLVEVDAMDYRTKAAQRASAAARDAGQIPLLPHEMQQVQDMAAVLLDHDDAAALFAPGTGQPEASLFFDGKAWMTPAWPKGTGPVKRRARLDWLSHQRLPDGRLVIPDYKTARSSEPARFAKAVVEHGYHQQASWYIDAVAGVGMTDIGDDRPPAFLFVAQEKTPPYVVSVLELDPDALMWGRELNEEALRRYRHCRTTRNWPGYVQGIGMIGLPKYAEYSYEKMLDN